MAREQSTILAEVHKRREAGYNCAEGTFWGVTRQLGLAAPVSCVTGFGGGMGGQGSVCGALTGAIAAIGIYFGRMEPEENEKKIACNEMVARVFTAFQKEMGTEFCREILGHLPGAGPAAIGINPRCQKAVTVAFNLALEEIEKGRDQV